MTDHLILSDSHYPLQIILHYYGRSLEQKRSESTGLLLPREVPSLALHALIWYISLMGLGLVSWLIGALLHLIPYRSASENEILYSVKYCDSDQLVCVTKLDFFMNTILTDTHRLLTIN